MKKYIQKKNKNKFYINRIKVIVKDEIDEISINDLEKTLTSAIRKIPEYLLSNLDTIHIGEFLELKKRKLQAFYKNSSVFMTNGYKESKDMVDDLVHEIAHSVEESHSYLIYSDKEIEKEFLRKRKELWQILKDKGFEIDLTYFLQTKYNQDFDFILYKNIGYQTLNALTNTIFYSPYGATSLREYFANGFEAFFMKEEIFRLKKISPALYKKMINLLDIEGEK